MADVQGANPSLIARGRSAVLPLKRLVPGLTASVTVAIAATFLSEHYRAPVMLFALLLGMALHFLSQEGPCVEGVEFASKRVLRVGVALLGAQITFAQIAGLGATPVIAVMVAVVLTIGCGALLARALGLQLPFGVLTGGAVAICGASAALAISAILPKTETSERDTVFTVIGVTALSTVAMIAYPIVAAALKLDQTASGIFIGGTIHDVAQVVGAGFAISEDTGHIATFTKLLRVAMLLPIVLALSLLFARGDAGSGRPPLQLPGFLVGFAALMALSSAGLIPEAVQSVLKEVSRWSLVTAIAALGMKTSLKAMTVIGLRPILLIVAETLFLAAIVLLTILTMR
jgi:uncharacterized integral membrane protein (TIGR00698 family)